MVRSNSSKRRTFWSQLPACQGGRASCHLTPINQLLSKHLNYRGICGIISWSPFR